MSLLQVQIRLSGEVKWATFWEGICFNKDMKNVQRKIISFQLKSFSKSAPILWSCVFLLNQRTVVEEQEHGEPQCRRGQQDQTDVAGDHEVSHHQGHLVLVPAVLLRWWWRGIVAPTHAPLQWPPPLQGGGDDGTRRATRGAQRSVGKNDGGGVRAEDEDEGKTKSKKRCVMVGVSAAVPAVHRGGDPVSVSVRESQQQAFSGFQTTHFYRK